MSGEGSIPRAFIVGGSGLVETERYNYYDHAPKGQRESDRAYFENKHGGTRRDDRLEQKRQSRRTSFAADRAAYKAAERAMIEKHAHVRDLRSGYGLAPEQRHLVLELAAIKDGDNHKWSWESIGRIAGMTGTAAKEIAVPEYGKTRNAYKSGKTPEQIEREQKREQAVRMLQLGIAQKDIAESVGVGHTTVSYWARKLAA